MCVCVSVCVRDKKRGKGGYVCVCGRVGGGVGRTGGGGGRAGGAITNTMTDNSTRAVDDSLPEQDHYEHYHPSRLHPRKDRYGSNPWCVDCHCMVPGSALTDGEGLSGRPRPLCRERAEMLSSAATVLHSFVASLSMQICDGHMQDANLRNVARRLGARIRCVDSYYRGDGPCAD